MLLFTWSKVFHFPRRKQKSFQFLNQETVRSLRTQDQFHYCLFYLKYAKGQLTHSLSISSTHAMSYTSNAKNSLLINPDKTKLLHIGVPQLMRTPPATLSSATILGTKIKPVAVTKDLGVHINCYLNYKEQITKTASDCMFKLRRGSIG
ncbi:hypothetical protein pdam_00010328 [Pocillopora damicornis]|uniref:Uncharacterized protein n=1 Tax=Pocillopora damicornis TaxID=46731 RepID=A0A3M6UDM3_POCDA|nr:hypothetical protein pdam_00010328 [Pocillopora damicornis]